MSYSKLTRRLIAIIVAIILVSYVNYWLGHKTIVVSVEGAGVDKWPGKISLMLPSKNWHALPHMKAYVTYKYQPDKQVRFRFQFGAIDRLFSGTKAAVMYCNTYNQMIYRELDVPYFRKLIGIIIRPLDSSETKRGSKILNSCWQQLPVTSDE